MKLLKRYLIANSMNSDIIVAQHPIIQKLMLKIILYAYTQSVFSGRRIEKLLHDSIRMMWLAQNQTLSYKTINRFRVNPNTDALIESLFIQFHSQCLKQKSY
ncbi:transposase [Staphylococcus aureus]|uniref:transposase n=1 Tax=Staphylococcus aureus TaxID=1280 RepID=UPI003C6F1B2B